MNYLQKLMLGVALLTSGVAQAQITSIRGRVKDVTGPNVPTAHVVLRNTGTGEEQVVDVTSTGDYTFVYLSPSIYNVTISSQGFATEERTAVHLGLDEILSVNVSLKPGVVSETVIVRSNEMILNTTNADRGTTFTHGEIENSPLNQTLHIKADEQDDDEIE